MDEETSVSAEETAEVSQPEENIESSEVEESPSGETEQASEETENTPSEESTEETAPPKSRAQERIQQLVAKYKALRSQQATPEVEPQIDGYDESGIDPIKYADSVVARARQEAVNAVKTDQSFNEAFNKFPLTKENNLVRARAAELFDQGYTPLQAGEIATLEFNETQQSIVSSSKARINADSKLKQTSQMQSAGSSAGNDGYFTFAQIDAMPLEEYRANKDEINRQLEAGLIT